MQFDPLGGGSHVSAAGAVVEKIMLSPDGGSSAPLD